MRITKKKITGVVAGAAVVALGAGAAFAYFTANGAATGEVTVGVSAATNALITFDGSLLYPGTPGAPVTDATFTNNNPFAVTITGFGVAEFSVTNKPHAGDCDPTWFSLVPTPPGSGLNLSVPAGGGTLSLPNPGYSVQMSNTGDQDGCQGATIAVSVPVIAVQS